MRPAFFLHAKFFASFSGQLFQHGGIRVCECFGKFSRVDVKWRITRRYAFDIVIDVWSSYMREGREVFLAEARLKAKLHCFPCTQILFYYCVPRARESSESRECCLRCTGEGDLEYTANTHIHTQAHRERVTIRLTLHSRKYYCSTCNAVRILRLLEPKFCSQSTSRRGSTYCFCTIL